MKKEGDGMLPSVTKRIIEIVADEIFSQVQMHPEVKSLEKDMDALLRAIFDGNIELYDKVENAIHDYTETYIKCAISHSFVHGMKKMNEIDQTNNQTNTPILHEP